MWARAASHTEVRGNTASAVRAPPRPRAWTRLLASSPAGHARWSGRWPRDRRLSDRRRTAGPAARAPAERRYDFARLGTPDALERPAACPPARPPRRPDERDADAPQRAAGRHAP